MKIYKHFETPEQAMAWASVKFIPNVNAIRATLARGEDYTAEVKNWDLEVVLTLNDVVLSKKTLTDGHTASDLIKHMVSYGDN